jgi:CHAD domain-containing protein
MAERVRELDHQAPALLAELETEHERARERLAAAMESSRYAALLEGLAALAHDPPFTAVAHLPASGLVRAQGRRDWRRIRGRVDTLPAPDDAAYERHLHEVRKAAKRLKYLLETGREVTGTEAKTLLSRLTSFQRRLGDHHDASLTGRLLADAGQPSAEVEAEAAAVAEEFPALWRRLSARKILRWLH